MNPAEISKAIGGGLAGAVVAVVARYGFQVDVPTASALAVILTAVVGYVVGHLAVYFAPANKPVI